MGIWYYGTVLYGVHIKEIPNEWLIKTLNVRERLKKMKEEDPSIFDFGDSYDPLEDWTEYIEEWDYELKNGQDFGDISFALIPHSYDAEEEKFLCIKASHHRSEMYDHTPFIMPDVINIKEWNARLKALWDEMGMEEEFKPSWYIMTESW